MDAADRLLFGGVGMVGEVDTLSGVTRYAQSQERRIGRPEERIFTPDEEE